MCDEEKSFFSRTAAAAGEFDRFADPAGSAAFPPSVSQHKLK